MSDSNVEKSSKPESSKNEPPAEASNSLRDEWFSRSERFQVANILVDNRDKLPQWLQPGIEFDRDGESLLYGRGVISKPEQHVVTEADNAVRELGAGLYQRREDASAVLAGMGNDAMFSLIKALRSRDAEIVQRTVAALEKLEPADGLDWVLNKVNRSIKTIDRELQRDPQNEQLRNVRIDAGLHRISAYLHANNQPELVKDKNGELQEVTPDRPHPFHKEIREELATLIRLKNAPLETMLWSEPPGGLDPIIDRNEALRDQLDGAWQRNPEDNALKTLRVAVGMNLLNAYCNSLDQNGRSVFPGKVATEMNRLRDIEPKLTETEEFRSFQAHINP